MGMGSGDSLGAPSRVITLSTPTSSMVLPLAQNSFCFLVLGMNTDCVRKECVKEGNTLTFNKARQMAKSEESADKQIQLMNTEVHPINSNKRFLNQTYQPRNNPRKLNTIKTVVRGPQSREQCPGKTCNMPLLRKGWTPS